MLKTKYNRQNKNKNNKQQQKSCCMQCIISQRKKKTGYMIPTMNCYPRNGQVRDPHFTCHKLYHPNQYQYLQHPILWVLFNIIAIILRARLIRVQSQHPIKQVGLTIYSKTSLVRNSDNMKYRTQKPCNENPSLKSADLLQTQRFIES